MPVTNQTVIELWKRGEQATNHRRSLYSLPDGSLYSYGLKIGMRAPSGAAIVVDFTAASGQYRSQTTSQHVNLAKRIGATTTVMHPKVWAASNFLNPQEEVPF